MVIVCKNEIIQIYFHDVHSMVSIYFNSNVDYRMVAESAIAPHQSCKAALMIKHAITKLIEVFRISSIIRAKKQNAVEQANKWKNIYNEAWILNYENIPQFWTFEYIINSFKVMLLLLRLVF